MADKKISALTAATLPLAGTEVLPIVQSGSTVKVATDDLTVKNIRSNATSGLLQVAGPGAGTTRVMTTPNANFTAARTDAAQSFTGDQTLSTGNLIQGTAAKGVNFTANTPAAGMTSQLLNWYEEGTWTPTLSFGGASTGITYASGYTNGRYTRIGNRVFIQGAIILSNKGSATGDASINGLPFTSLNALDAYPAISLAFRNVTYANQFQGLVIANSTRIDLFEITEAGVVTSLTNADFANSSEIQFSANYCI